MQNIISPRRVVAYCAIGSVDYWITDTGLFESYNMYSYKLRNYGYAPIAGQNGYWDSDVSNFSMACGMFVIIWIFAL